MDQHPDFKNLGRQGNLSSSFGMWPNGEPHNLRAAYDHILQAGTKTKVCYACGGSGKNGNKQCTACHGRGEVPSA